MQQQISLSVPPFPPWAYMMGKGSSLKFPDMTDQYLNGYLQTRSSYRAYQRIYRQYFSTWVEHPTRHAISQWHKGLAGTPSHANKGLSFLKALYNWAMNDGLWTEANPAVGIRRHKTYSRERIMDYREIATLVAALPVLNQKYQAWFTCRLLVPCRIKELCQMRREDVDTYGKWTKRTTKNGRPHVIHIPRQSLALLQALPNEGPYFFMGQYGHPLSEDAVRKIWARWRKAMGLNNLWLLDYRRTLATYLYRVMKTDDLTAKAVLNHYDSRPVAIYTRLDYDFLASIIQGYADWIYTIAPPNPVASDTVRIL